MKTAWPIGRVFGIPIRLHISFFLIVAWMAWQGWDEGGWRASVWAAALILALFACVVLHELGHSLVAMAFGAKVRSVTLYPIGGVAGLDRVPRRPSRELLMALAGPAVNAVIALSLTLLRGSFPSWSEEATFPSSLGQLRDALIHANVVLGVFNLLPAFPMDGGRVLRSVVALFFPYSRATSLAAAIGQALAVGLLLLGVALGNPFLAVIAVFVFLGAGREEALVKIQTALQGLHAEDVMIRDFVIIQASDPIRVCADRDLAGMPRHFVVEAAGRVVGVISDSTWRKALQEKGADAPAHTVMQKAFLSVDARAPLDRLYMDLHGLEQTVFPVIQEGRLVGILTFEDIVKRLVVRPAEDKTAHGLAATEEHAEEIRDRFTVDLG